ncbi:hypothetical protein O3M35_012305 [Rhynocoris fuscipes]|uniref:palmitoyl-protein hydrolase n=1 Tax=Rhynocoris fuscipes TaxID=488301 RepID=A0AAW1CZA1_9HEMI
MTIPTWYDISGFTMNATENDSEIHSVATNLQSLVDDQIKKGIPLNRIVFAGHSRGGAMAMHMAFTSLKQIAGVATVGSFLPITSTLFQDLCKSKDYVTDIPLLLQLHGSADRLVSKHIGIETFRNLVTCGIPGIFRSYYKVGHLLTKTEIKHLYKFVNLLLPPI